jgi:hypothetical protein
MARWRRPPSGGRWLGQQEAAHEMSSNGRPPSRRELELEREGADVTRAQVGGRIEREAHEARSNGRPAALGQHDAVGTRCGRPSAHRREAASSPILEFSTCPWFRYNLLQ